MNRKLVSVTGLILATTMFLGINIISNETLTSARLDLTENRLYTLAPGTYNILSDISEPLSIRLYFSSEQLAGLPQLANYGKRVKDLLNEYVANSNGKIKLYVIDPAPFSEAEDEAVGAGIRQLSLGSNGEVGYLGLVATNTTDDREVIEVLSPDQENALEYDLTKIIYKLNDPKKRIIGLITDLPILSETDPQTGQVIKPDLTAITFLKEFHEIKRLPIDSSLIDDEIDTLILVHPKDLSVKTQYAIDQFLVKGGKALVFVDPLAEQDPTQPNPETPGVMPQLGSRLDTIFEAVGIKLNGSHVIGDPSSAVRVNFNTARGQREVDYLPWIQLQGKSLNKEDFTTNQLNTVNVGTAGSLEIDPKPNLTYTPLLTASTSSGLIDKDSIITADDPSSLIDDFNSDEKNHLIAVRVTGNYTSNFSAPPSSELEVEESKYDLDKSHLLTSEYPTNLILVSDTDILADRFWVRFSGFAGMRIPEAFANNADFLVNAVDNLGGNDDLISLRSRGQYTRPFEVVLDIQRKAEEQFRDKEQALQEKLKLAEENLSRIQGQQIEGELILSAEQQIEVEKFRSEQVSTRKELRAVQHELQDNIDRLGSMLTFANTALVPLLIFLSLIVANGLKRFRPNNKT
jgi:ABC-type uncharacterized transport system involved in gliding motility auxiliary subunit